MSDEKTERGRFVAQGRQVVLLHEDGRIEAATKGRPEAGQAGGCQLHLRSESTYSTAPSDGLRELPFSLLGDAAIQAQKHIEDLSEKFTRGRSYIIEVRVAHLDEGYVQPYIDAAGCEWTTVTPQLEGFGYVYTWRGLTRDQASRICALAGIDPDQAL